MKRYSCVILSPGTGGALAHAMPVVRSNPFLIAERRLVLRGSIPERLLRFHTRKRAGATIARHPDEAEEDAPAPWRWEKVTTSCRWWKNRERGQRTINAGVYLFVRAVTTFFRTCRSGFWSRTCRRVSSHQ